MPYIVASTIGRTRRSTKVSTPRSSLSFRKNRPSDVQVASEPDAELSVGRLQREAAASGRGLRGGFRALGGLLLVELDLPREDLELRGELLDAGFERSRVAVGGLGGAG